MALRRTHIKEYGLGITLPPTIYIMAFIRPVIRLMPDGREAYVLPFHISYEGLETNIICRDDQDCDSLVKCIFVCARRKNVIVIIYAVVSNHAHVAVLAASREVAEKYAAETKRTYSQLFQRRYKEGKVLRQTDVKVTAIDTDWYLRNVLAYIPRNAYDNGAKNMADYKWTGFRAFFKKKNNSGLRPVRNMTTREWREFFHTGDNLGDVRWMLNSNNELEPSSTCDIGYLENAFNHNETFFYKCIGSVNVAEMTQKLVVNPRKALTDADFFKEIEATSQKWYSSGIATLSASQKSRLIPYIYHTVKTGVPQLARGFGMPREDIQRILRLRKV